jgi:ethanolamine utilization cobalamin adenosyltransferase
MTSPLLQHGVKAEITKNSLLTPPAQEWFAELHIGLLSIAVPAGGAQ